MSRIILVFTLLSCAYGFPSGKQHGEKISLEKIVGGEETTINKHPYQVSLRINDGQNFYTCGGSIISNRWILTAAHCLSNAINITIRAGSAQLYTGGTMLVSTTFKVHPSHNKPTLYDNDVGVVYAPRDLILNNSTMKIVTLANNGTNVPTGTTVVVSGWGTTLVGGQRSTILREVTVSTIDRKKCARKYRVIYQPITTRMICAGLSDGGKNACKGDSGGPLVDPDGKQVGIVSFEYGCGQRSFPAVFTNVAAVRDWIKQNTGV